MLTWPGRITLQQIRICQPTFNAAFIAYVEASREHDNEKNGLCPPNPYPDSAVDMLRGVLIQQRATNDWNSTPDIVEWLARSRLNAAYGLADHMDDPRTQEAMTCYLTFNEPGIKNLERLLAAV